VRVWQADDWWLARVVAASDGADAALLNALTQARSLARIESMARDLVATILDAGEDTFRVDFDYILPGGVGEHVVLANDARSLLNAAQELWQERSTLAVRALARAGYSLRETATLLGLSHQRVDQILGANADPGHANVLVFQPRDMTSSSQAMDVVYPSDVEVLLVVRRELTTAGDRGLAEQQADISLGERIRALFSEVAWRFSGQAGPARPGPASTSPL
jgi:hypothetical protein